MKFEDIIGQSRLKEMLVKGVDEGRVSHAQLFVGECGSGTLPLALAYAQYLNCTDRRDGEPCGECSSCMKMSQLMHPDLHFVFPINASKASGSAKPTSDNFLAEWRKMVTGTGGYFDEQMWYSAIDMENQQGMISKNEADEIIKKLSFKSFEGTYKIMLIWMPERMRIEAANSLLKILEEPWDRTVFLMVCASPSKLLSTIISRTQEVSVPRINTEHLECHLIEMGCDDEKARDVARLSIGNLIEARRLSGTDESQAAQDNFQYFVDLMRLSYNDKHMELLQWAENVAEIGRENQKRFLQNSIRLLRNNYMMNAGMDEISYLWGEELDFCKKFSPFIGNHNIENLVREVEKTIAQITQNGNPKIIFAHFALTVSKQIVKQ